jgi:hypothetical protein
MTDYETLKNRVDIDDGTYWWALMEIERLREALRPFAEKSTDCDSGYEWLVVKRDDCDKARAALGEGKE